MNCYQFERIITHYIDNDLKQTDRHQFNDHKEQCNVCSEKLRNIEKTILTMTKIPKHVTSSQFNNNLQEKIIITTTAASTWKKIFEFKIFGYEPKYALGMVSSICIILISISLIIELDTQPSINISNIKKNKISNTNSEPSEFEQWQYEPLMNSNEIVAHDDTTINNKSKLSNDKIIMVNSPK